MWRPGSKSSRNERFLIISEGMFRTFQGEQKIVMRCRNNSLEILIIVLSGGTQEMLIIVLNGGTLEQIAKFQY